jgi:peptide/nickel transport system permease protein
LTLAAFVARRLAWMGPVLLGLTLVTFSLTWVATQGDLARGFVTDKMTDQQVQQLRHDKGFDQPFLAQYVRYLGRLATGDLGVTKTGGLGERPITQVLGERFPATLELALAAMAFAVAAGIPLGTFAAKHRGRLGDHAARVLTLAGMSMPIFWLGLMLKTGLASDTGLALLPLGGRFTPALALTHPVLDHPGPTGMLMVDTLLAGDGTAFVNVAQHLVLPAVTLGIGTLAMIARMMRSSMLEQLQQDYVRTARAKGVPWDDVVRRHARPNALLPTATLIGLAFGALLGGAVLTEAIFQWPGIGDWSARAVASLDPNAVLSFTVIVAIVYVGTNLAVDVGYALLDPRVRLA